MGEAGREIGGYFELERFNGVEYHREAMALNCARNCLVYLLEARHINSLLIPHYLCSSVATAARKAGAHVTEYDISPDFLPNYQKIQLGEHDYLYLVDYYGQLTNEDILNARRWCGGRLIMDEVHNFFRFPLEGVDTLYSCRKFFGVPDGAYLYTDARIDHELARDESRNRMTYLLGRAEGSASDYYAYYAENDASFAGEPMRLMSPITHNLLCGIDYGQAAQRRTENFMLLNKLLEQYNQLSITTPAGAFMYPLLIDNAEPIRSEMQRRRIYVPTLWPNATPLDSISGRYARNILPLPIDQRYDTDDMAYVASNLVELLDSRH